MPCGFDPRSGYQLKKFSDEVSILQFMRYTSIQRNEMTVATAKAVVLKKFSHKSSLLTTALPNLSAAASKDPDSRSRGT